MDGQLVAPVAQRRAHHSVDAQALAGRHAGAPAHGIEADDAAGGGGCAREGGQTQAHRRRGRDLGGEETGIVVAPALGTAADTAAL